MNHVVLIGRLTKDPELRYIPGTGTVSYTHLDVYKRQELHQKK